MLSSPSPVLGLIFIATIVGKIVDWHYVRAGGRRSSRGEKILFWPVALAIAATIVLAGYLGADPDVFSHTTRAVVLALLGGWELGRWRTRRNFPLGKVPAQPQ
jgi:4-amino-4-deoxy-L-arabinose transferase-like glycosyltransferase